jgi:hypothetical protein
MGGPEAQVGQQLAIMVPFRAAAVKVARSLAVLAVRVV